MFSSLLIVAILTALMVLAIALIWLAHRGELHTPMGLYANRTVWLLWLRKPELQLCAILAACLITLGIYDSKLRSLNFDYQRLQASQIAVDDILLAINSPTTCKEPLPVVLFQTPANISEDPVAQMYDARQSSSDYQARLDEIKTRYEEILVTYFYLKRCKQAQSMDYHLIISSLATEMASVNAPGRLQYDILTSARGSYRELYAVTRCDAPGTDTLKEGYQRYIQSIAKNIFKP
ncbi:MAG: hypothetical protein SFW63_08170 [Alphaproteobacteria bacterium]|nr:hypothetical protein [Alphaproteobacteria bacterium]